jgi:hypothetical protein
MQPPNRQYYCPSCPRAILCISRNEETLPIAECVKCCSLKRVMSSIQIVSSYPNGSGSIFHVTLCECTQQEPLPRSRKLCPAVWADALKDIDETMSPFICYKCGGPIEAPVAPDHFRMNS